MQCQYFLIAEGEDSTDDGFHENVDFHRFNTLWWFEWSLEELARELNVTPLTELISLSRRELIRMIGEEEVVRVESEGWVGDGATPLEAEWFPAEKGLRTVSALLRHIHTRPESLAAAQPGERHDILVSELVSALQALEADLERLKQQRKRFRLCKQ